MNESDSGSILFQNLNDIKLVLNNSDGSNLPKSSFGESQQKKKIIKRKEIRMDCIIAPKLQRGDYKMTGSVIAKGGFSTVYSGYDVKKGKSVAMKRIHANVNSDKHIMDKVILEVNLHWTLNERKVPGVAELYGYFIENGEFENTKYYILVMKYYDGNVCDLLFSSQSGLTENLLNNFGMKMNFLLRISEILEEIHQQGIIHRDIKPANILYCKNDSKIEYFISDFGLSEQICNLGVFQKGTPIYFPPELTRKGRYYKEEHHQPSKIDIYSFGILCWETFFGSITKFFEIRKIDFKSLWIGYRPPLSNILPLSVKDLIDHSWNHDLKKRYSNFGMVISQIKRIMKSNVESSFRYLLVPNFSTPTLVNVGNNYCYINAGIQCLFRMPGVQRLIERLPLNEREPFVEKLILLLSKNVHGGINHSKKPETVLEIVKEIDNALNVSYLDNGQKMKLPITSKDRFVVLDDYSVGKADSAGFLTRVLDYLQFCCRFISEKETEGNYFLAELQKMIFTEVKTIKRTSIKRIEMFSSESIVQINLPLNNMESKLSINACINDFKKAKKEMGKVYLSYTEDFGKTENAYFIEEKINTSMNFGKIGRYVLIQLKLADVNENFRRVSIKLEKNLILGMKNLILIGAVCTNGHDHYTFACPQFPQNSVLLYNDQHISTHSLDVFNEGKLGIFPIVFLLENLNWDRFEKEGKTHNNEYKTVDEETILKNPKKYKLQRRTLLKENLHDINNRYV